MIFLFSSIIKSKNARKYKLNLPTYHSEKENYSLNQQEYHSEKQPTAIPSESIKDYHMKSVENYIGDSGKEFEGAAEKIVEGYMGEYMDKYMNEWYVKYCKDTGKYCDQIKVVPINNNELDSTKNKNYQSYEKTQQEQYYPSILILQMNTSNLIMKVCSHGSDLIP